MISTHVALVIQRSMIIGQSERRDSDGVAEGDGCFIQDPTRNVEFCDVFTYVHLNLEKCQVIQTKLVDEASGIEAREH